MVNDRPCSFVRFSGFDADRPHSVTRYSSRLDMTRIGDAAELFARYARLLTAAGYQQTKAWPYAYYRRINELRALARQVRLRSRLHALAVRLLRGIHE